MHENLFISFMACALVYMLLTIILMRWGRFGHDRTPTLQVCRLSCRQAGRWWRWLWACRASVFMCKSCSQRSNVVKEATARRPKPNRDTENYENIWRVVGLSISAATQHLAEKRSFPVSVEKVYSLTMCRRTFQSLGAKFEKVLKPDCFFIFPSSPPPPPPPHPF